MNTNRKNKENSKEIGKWVALKRCHLIFIKGMMLNEDYMRRY